MLKKSAVTLAILMILLGFVLANVKVAYPSDTDGSIDLFTQKEPYSGRGLNISSDAFGPGEEVRIYANATYNDSPVNRLLVAFEISGPKNPVENITVYRSAFTNETGIAVVSFRVSHLNETTFGVWSARGNVMISDSTFQDVVMFKVGWIVEIAALRTINEWYVDQDKFQKGSHVGIELTLRSIAMTEKTTTLTVTIYDCLSIFVNATELNDFVVPPNETLVYAYFSLYISKDTHVGRATVYACAYTAPPEFGGVPYCPEVSKHFYITAQEYFLKVKTEPADFTTIPGEGWYEEHTNASLTAPYAVLIAAGVRYKFSYWDIDGASQGVGVDSINVFMDANHTATAHYILQYYLTVDSPYATSGGAGWYNAGSIAYATLDISLLDHENETRRMFINWSGDASGTNYTQSNPILMDKRKTAIANWKTQYYLTVKTDPLGITSIFGEGWYDESANVSINAPTVSGYSFDYWDVNGISKGGKIDPITVLMSAPQIATAHYTQIMTYTLTITATAGGTTNPTPGTYNYTSGSTVQVKAIPNKDYIFDHWELDGADKGSDNPYSVLMDANHTLKAVFSPTIAGWFIPDWFYWLLLLLLLLFAILLIVWLYRRRRRKKASEAFYSGWMAWYYCYDLRNKTAKLKPR